MSAFRKLPSCRQLAKHPIPTPFPSLLAPPHLRLMRGGSGSVGLGRGATIWRLSGRAPSPAFVVCRGRSPSVGRCEACHFAVSRDTPTVPGSTRDLMRSVRALWREVPDHVRDARRRDTARSVIPGRASALTRDPDLSATGPAAGGPGYLLAQIPG